MSYGRARILASALVVAGAAWCTPALPAQDEVATSGEIKAALRSPNSGIRHDTWKRLNPEESVHLKRLIWVLKSKPWYDREGAIDALAKAFSEKVLDRMVKYLHKDRDPAVRQGMAAALAKMNDKKYYKELYEALDDKDPRVRREVVWRLRVRKKEEAVDALVKRFLEEEDPVVKTYLEATLNDLTQAFRGPNPRAWRQWWETAKNDPDYKLGEMDDDAKKAAEELGKKLKKSRTRLADVDLDTAERGIGEGVPILVLPYYGYSRETMLPFLSELERYHKVIYIDLPKIDSFKGLENVGATGMPYYPIDKLVEAFEALREEKKQEHFAIMACGMNSWIAMRYASLYPKSVAAMILICPYSGNKTYGRGVDRCISIGKSKKDRELEYYGYSQRVNTQTGKSILEQNHEKDEKLYPRMKNEQACIERRSWAAFFYDDRDGVLSQLFGKRRNHPGGVLIPEFDCYRETKPKRRVPTLICSGKNDVRTTPDDGKGIAKHFSGVPVVYTRSAGMPFVEEAPKFNRDVIGFLRKNTRAKSSKKRK